MTDIKVFSKEWFKKYSKAITWVARLPILGELIFNFKKYGHYVDRKNVCEVTPNSVVEYLGTKGEKAELRQHFFVRNEYALRLQHVFYPIWITFHIWDIITRPIPRLNLGFDTLTVYPDTTSGGTAFNGYVSRQGVDETFATIWGGNGTNAASSSLKARILASTTSNQYAAKDRIGISFDTSGITSGGTISSAVLSIYFTNVNIGLGDVSYCGCDFNPANADEIVSSDYGNFPYQTWYAGCKKGSDISTGEYTDFTLSSAGKSNINKTGVSSFGIRSNCGINGNSSGITWASGAESGVEGNSSVSSSNKPKLVITGTSFKVSFIPRTTWF